ncbi:hypothetical protein [Streptomyces roseoviridis]|uniref:hypothetical protein n=1 Tax=Streptomyces roseoviridis TaxID=67361 RepID=UPI0031E52298
MSDDILSIIPSDPRWQPDSDAADSVVALVEELAPGADGGVDVEIEVMWHDAVTAVDCGANLEAGPTSEPSRLGRLVTGIRPSRCRATPVPPPRCDGTDPGTVRRPA